MLPLFGYDLFEGSPSTFAPIDNVPVTADYVVGPGDELLIRAWGQIDIDYRYRCAFLRKAQRSSAAHAGRRSGNNANFVPHSHTDVSLLGLDACSGNNGFPALRFFREIAVGIFRRAAHRDAVQLLEALLHLRRALRRSRCHPLSRRPIRSSLCD